MSLQASDSRYCPLCQQVNLCECAVGRSGENCWCHGVEFPRELLKKVPLARRGQACICETCARRYCARRFCARCYKDAF